MRWDFLYLQRGVGQSYEEIFQTTTTETKNDEALKGSSSSSDNFKTPEKAPNRQPLKQVTLPADGSPK
eukprot:8026476-Alexandrium_andersonii.AAC.1